MIEFSVVIAVYNKERFLASTLESVLAQEYPHFELIIVNDGSTDTSGQIIESFLSDSRCRYISQDNQGVSAARNTGIKSAKYEYIALIDADDTWDPNYLKNQASLIETYPEEFCFATAQYLQVKGKKFQKRYSIQLEPNQMGVFNYFEASRYDPLIHSSAVVIKKSVFETIGMFDPDILTGEDTDLWIRIGLRRSIAFYNLPCSVYTISSGGLFTSSTSVEQLLNLDAYKEQESKRNDLKQYLDLNRYAQAIQAKLWGQKEAFIRLASQIEPSNLNAKQRFLLKLPKPFLQLFLKIKWAFDAFGLRLTAFR